MKSRGTRVSNELAATVSYRDGNECAPTVVFDCQDVCVRGKGVSASASTTSEMGAVFVMRNS